MGKEHQKENPSSTFIIYEKSVKVDEDFLVAFFLQQRHERRERG
jgi:hypothetical protein